MTAEERKLRAPLVKRGIMIILGLMLFLALVLAVLRVFITTPHGSRFIENQVNSRSFGAVEGVNISGLSGDPLTAFSIESLNIKDKDGVWLEAQNLSLTWNPLAYFKDHIWVKALEIEQTRVLRRPKLNAGGPGGNPLKVTLETFVLPSIDMDESLFGRSMSLETSGQFIVQSNRAVAANIKAVRIDEPGDSLELDFSRTSSGVMTGLFDVEGAEDGPVAALLKAPAAVSGRGQLSGTDTQGSGSGTISFGSIDTITASAEWTPAAIEAKAEISLEGWPAFSSIRARLGDTLDSRIRFDRREGNKNTPRLFTARINVPGLSLDADGALPEHGYIPARANIDAKADDISSYVSLPDEYSAKQATAKGQVSLAKPYAFDGQISLRNISTPYGTTAQISGPLAATQTDADTVNFTTDLTVTDAALTANLPIEIAAKTRITSRGTFEQASRRIRLSHFNLVSGNNRITSQGPAGANGESLDLTGSATASIKAHGSIPDGVLKADFSLQKTQTSPLLITTDGAFKPSAPMAPPLDALIGDQLVFAAKISPAPEGLTLSDVSLTGDKISAALMGTAGDSLNLLGEAALSAPFIYQSVEFGDSAEVSFAVTGTPADPNIRLDATANSVTIQRTTIQSLRLRTEIMQVRGAPKGHVQIEAQTQFGALAASAQLASTPDMYVANDIALTWGQLRTDGDLSLTRGGIASGQLTLSLPEVDGQFARASLELSNRAGEQAVTMTAEAQNVAVSSVQFDTLSANADGTLAMLSGNVAAAGRNGTTLLARQFDIAIPFRLLKNNGSIYTATMSPEAAYGDINIATLAPVSVTYNGGDIDFTAPLAIADGTMDIAYTRKTAEETLTLSAKALPVTLLRMSGNLADTRGRVSADIGLSSQNYERLQGGGTIKLTDWRGFDSPKGEGLSSDVRFDINGPVANVTLTAQSPAGFSAESALKLPISPANTLMETRLDMTAPVSGTFTAGGAAASIFGLITPSDSELGGTLSANITIAGTLQSPCVDGQASGQDIRFEAPELGTQIKRGHFLANFTQDSLSLSELYFADGNTGSLSGSGNFTLGKLGRPIGTIDIKAERFRALERRDVEATVNGTLEFTSTDESAGLTGDITINKAEIKQFVSGSVSVIEIDVEEINRPAASIEMTVRPPTTPIAMDLRIRAPRRIYIRSRGLDVEMSVDAQVKGTLTDPLLYGEAVVLRGGFNFAGKTLDFEDGTIKFDGDIPGANVDFKAVTETQNLDSSVTITGTVENPEITLSSSPQRPQDEILSALLFGRSAAQLSPIEAAQLAGALAQLSGSGAGFDLLGGLRKAFGFNQLSVTFGQDGSAQLVGGRYLAKNVYLQILSGAGPDQTGAIIDWEIRKNITLRSRIRADNNQALSLKWKRDF